MSKNEDYLLESKYSVNAGHCWVNVSELHAI